MGLSARRYFEGKYISTDRIIVKIYLLQVPDLIIEIDLGEVSDMVLSNCVGEEKVVLFEVRILELLPQEDNVLFGGSHEIDGLEVHQFFLDVLDLLYEVDIVFIEFGLSVDDGDDSRGLTVQDEGLHF